jgi:hypothetical protein
MKQIVMRGAVAIGLAAVIGLAHSATVDSQGQSKPDQATSKESSRGKVGEDKNVKEAEGVNVQGKPSTLPGPAEKTGETTRQVLCSVMFDNYTNLWVQTYVDGRFAGTMRPWGELYTFAVSGPTILYARAEYTNKTYDSWGPVNVSCSRSYRWRLNP